LIIVEGAASDVFFICAALTSKNSYSACTSSGCA
jgi:hypothetical protein